MPPVRHWIHALSTNVLLPASLRHAESMSRAPTTHLPLSSRLPICSPPIRAALQRAGDPICRSSPTLASWPHQSYCAFSLLTTWHRDKNLKYVRRLSDSDTSDTPRWPISRTDKVL